MGTRRHVSMNVDLLPFGIVNDRRFYGRERELEQVADFLWKGKRKTSRVEPIMSQEIQVCRRQSTSFAIVFVTCTVLDYFWRWRIGKIQSRFPVPFSICRIVPRRCFLLQRRILLVSFRVAKGERKSHLRSHVSVNL